MNKKAFTLVELLAVISILAIVLLITVPNVVGVIKKSKDKLTEEQKLSIENAARAWGLKNLYYDENKIMSDDNEVKSVSVKMLRDAKMLDKKDFKNLLSSSDLNKIGVCIEYSSNQFVYKFTENIDEC